MPTRCPVALPIELVHLILGRAVHHFIIEHPATAVAIARVSRVVYDLARPALYRDFIGPLTRDPRDFVQLDFDALRESNQALVQRLFLAPYSFDITGADSLINLVEFDASHRFLSLSGRRCATRIICAAIRSRIDDVASIFGSDARSLIALPNLTHLTLLAASPRSAHMMDYIVRHLLGTLTNLTHFGLELSEDESLVRRTSTISNTDSLELEQKRYARHAVDSVQAALEFGLDVEQPGRRCLHRVALRVPAAHAQLWECLMRPRIIEIMDTTYNKTDLSVKDRLLVWCETCVCDNFAQNMINLRRDFLARKDLWSEAIPFGSILTVSEKGQYMFI